MDKKKSDRLKMYAQALVKKQDYVINILECKLFDDFTGEDIQQVIRILGTSSNIKNSLLGSEFHTSDTILNQTRNIEIIRCLISIILELDLEKLEIDPEKSFSSNKIEDLFLLIPPENFKKLIEAKLFIITEKRLKINNFIKFETRIPIWCSDSNLSNEEVFSIINTYSWTLIQNYKTIMDQFRNMINLNPHSMQLNSIVGEACRTMINQCEKMKIKTNNVFHPLTNNWQKDTSPKISYHRFMTNSNDIKVRNITFLKSLYQFRIDLLDNVLPYKLEKLNDKKNDQ